MSTALDVINELKALEDAEGRLTAERVVEAARDPESALHSAFTWDDGEAATQHRLNQARSLIRNVRVQIEVRERIVDSIAYVRDPEAQVRDQGYRSITGLRLDEVNARSAAVNEFVRANFHLRRAREIGQNLGLQIEDINAILEQVGVVIRRVESEGPELTQ